MNILCSLHPVANKCSSIFFFGQVLPFYHGAQLYGGEAPFREHNSGKLLYISQGVVALGYKPVKSYNLDTQSEEPYLLPVPQ